jgi:hypothetical protein
MNCLGFAKRLKSPISATRAIARGDPAQGLNGGDHPRQRPRGQKLRHLPGQPVATPLASSIVCTSSSKAICRAGCSKR